MDLVLTTSAAFKAAEVYEQFFVPGIFRFWTPQLLKRAGPKLGEKVLDVACGTGVVARSIVPLVGNTGKVFGLDINPAMLEVACRQYSDYCDDIDWREGQAEEIPFPNNSFDLVTCQQGLQFFRNRSRAAQEIRRVLRPEGRAVIEVWQSLETNSFYLKMFDVIGSVFQILPADLGSPYSFGDPIELNDLFRSAGFREVKVESVQQDVHFSRIDRFVELTIKGAAAVVPAFAQLATDEVDSLYSTVTGRIAGLLNEHTKGGVLTIPMYANIATAVS